MKVILLPENGRKTCLSQHHLLILAVVGLVLLPVVLGGVIYRTYALVDGASHPGMQALRAEQRDLATQRAAIRRAQAQADAHMNILAQKLGQLQAQMMQVNALGSRLAHLAGLDKTEFDFSTQPGMGGPEVDLPPVAAPDLTVALAAFSANLDRQSARLKALETLMLDRQVQAAVTPSGWPVQGGWVSSGYGPRADPFTGRYEFHTGIDIAARLGTPIKAVADGVVSFVGQRMGYGNVVEITHSSGLVTRYAHMRAPLVKVGDRVEKGEPIGLVGSTGRSTGPHLHFEVLRDGHPVNPDGYLKISAR